MKEKAECDEDNEWHYGIVFVIHLSFILINKNKNAILADSL
jgi:hypothetical protein